MKRKQDGKFRKKNKLQGRLLAILFVSILVAGGYIAYQTPLEAPVLLEKPDMEQVVQQATAEAIAGKIKILEDGVLEQLSIGCETLDLEDPDGAIVFDTAARGDKRRMSIGRFQFQRRTIQHYVKVFTGREISNAEAIAIAINPETSSELARQIIFDRGEVKRNWYNCTNKFNLDGQVEIINKLR